MLFLRLINDPRSWLSVDFSITCRCYQQHYAMSVTSLFEPDAYPALNSSGNISIIDDDFFIICNLDDASIYFDPTRLQNFVLSLCLDGHTRIMVNMQEYFISPGTALVVTSDQIFQSLEISEDYKFLCIALSKKFSDEVLGKLKVMLPLHFYTREYPCLNLSGTELKRAIEYCNMLCERARPEQTEYTKEAIISLLVSMFYELFDTYRNRLPRSMAGKNRKSVLFDHFMKALSGNHKKERSVDFYARTLFLTPKHLSSVVKEVSGKTAGEWIDNFVIFEAKLLLEYSEKSIQEIANELNFSNQSFFGKYFKNCTGMSPKEFRKK